MPYEVLIEYTLDPGARDEAEDVRQAFLAAVRGWDDPGFGYRVFQKGDDGQFVHISWLADEAAQRRLGEQDFFATFSEAMERLTRDRITATRPAPLGAAGVGG